MRWVMTTTAPTHSDRRSHTAIALDGVVERATRRSTMPQSQTANIGVVGLAVMGSNLARNFASREGNTVAVFNRSYEKTEALVTEHPEANFVATKTYEEFAASLSTPRTALIMVKAGGATDAVINSLIEV